VLDGLVDTLTPWFRDWGLIILFVATFIESSVVVASIFPGETVLLLGGFFASPSATGTADPIHQVTEVILWAFAGAVLGDIVGYLIGRWGGKKIVSRWGRYFFLPPKRLPLMERYFRSYGMRAILVGRFAPFLRSVRTLVAGTVRMPFGRFILADVIGGALWVTAIVVTGYVLGESWSVAKQYIGAGGAVVLAILVVLFALTWHRVGIRLEREMATQGAAADLEAGGHDEDKADSPDQAAG